VESKRALVMENVRTVLPFLKEGLDEGPSRAVYPSEDTGPPEEGDELLFINDEEGPNVAWVWSHHNKVAFSYFKSFLEGFRECAHVMWDSQQLNQWGLLKADAESLADAKPSDPSRQVLRVWFTGWSTITSCRFLATTVDNIVPRWMLPRSDVAVTRQRYSHIFADRLRQGWSPAKTERSALNKERLKTLSHPRSRILLCRNNCKHSWKEKVLESEPTSLSDFI
jgi:hypothetical protein